MAETSLLQKNARCRVDMFKREYDRGIVLLACHAALPVVLNTELLHLIRINFFLDTPEQLSYTEESDLLLSPICQEIGTDLYEIESEVRNILLQELVNEYGYERIREIAGLLWQYTEQRSPWEDHIRLKCAQQLTALNFLNPLKSQEWLADAEELANHRESDLQDWFVAMYQEIGGKKFFSKHWKRERFVELRHKIVKFLESLWSIISDRNKQLAFIQRAELEKPLLYSIKLGGPPAQFVRLLCSTALQYGQFKDGRYALEVILEAAKNYVGGERREYCEQLIQECYPFLKEPDIFEEETQPDEMKQKNNFPSGLKHRIIEFLQSLPNNQTMVGRSTLLFDGALDNDLERSINLTGPNTLFFERLVSQLIEYGRLRDGRYPLEAILKTAKNFVGQDRKEYCSALIQEFHIFLANPEKFEDEIQEETQEESKIEKKGKKSLHVGLENKIIEFLQTLPDQTEFGRLGLILGAGLDRQLQNSIDFTLSGRQFYESLISTLINYGQLQNGRHALTAILETAKGWLKEKEYEVVYCDFLLQELQTFLDETNISEKQKLVLIVDDNPKDRRRLAQIFQKLGCEVREAATNAHALELLEHNLTCSLVTTDALRYPEYAGEDGYVGLELIKKINQRFRFPELPIVLISFDSPELLRAQASDLHVKGVIGKHLPDEEISAALQKVLNGESLPNPWSEQAKHNGAFLHNETIRHNRQRIQTSAQTSLEGFQFEEQVANIFRKTGAKVEQEMRSADKGVDLYVEWTPQEGQTQKLAVQVKSYNKPLDANIILSFAAQATHLQDEGNIDQLAVVANKGFTQEARTEAQKLGIQLFEIDKLESVIKESFLFTTDQNQIGKEARKLPKYLLRSTPLKVSSKEFQEVFKLDKDWRPLEYIKNEFENQGETIIDHATGLMWQKSGLFTFITYKNAQEYVEQLNQQKFAGYDDWRLPTIEELMSLLEPKKQSNGLYINSIFDTTQRWCWGADSLPDGEFSSAGPAWFVNFHYGFVRWSDRYRTYYVRGVRSIN